MKNHRISLRYATALFELAEREGKLDALYKELVETTELVQKHPEISNLLMNTTIAREEKEDFLEKILPEKTAQLILNFIKVLIKKKRFEDLVNMTQDFGHLYEEKKGIQRVQVQSPIALDEILKNKLRQALEKKTNRQIIIESAVNPQMLGGLILDFEGTQIDGSFRTALHELKQKLLAPVS